MVNILLVVYSFPPNPGVGGRRWAKFAKYLARNGYTVHVITAPHLNNKKSLWCNDVVDKRIKIHEMYSLRYPKILRTVPGNILEKLYYKVLIFLLMLSCRGTIYDPTVFWENMFLIKAASLIKRYNIINVIITGAPFRLLYYGTKLKDKYGSEINLISDFRDPWVWGPLYGFKELQGKRQEYEQSMQDIVLEKSDYIITATENICDYLKKTYRMWGKKIVLIPHAYDREDFSLPPKIRRNRGEISFIYAGTIYDGTEPHIDALVEAVSLLLVKHKELSESITIDFFIENRATMEKFEKAGTEKIVKFHNFIEPEQLFERMFSADYIFAFRPDEFKNDLSTKYFEILFLRKPIIYVGSEGLISRFIVGNGIGLHFNVSSFRDQFLRLVLNPDHFQYNQNFNIEPYSYEHLTGKLQKLLK